MEGITILSDLPPRVAPNTPIEMPKFGFGAAPIGDLFIETSEAEVQSTLVTAWDLGVRYYDTAPWYGHGLSEHRLGSLLRQHHRDGRLSIALMESTAAIVLVSGALWHAVPQRFDRGP